MCLSVFVKVVVKRLAFFTDAACVVSTDRE